MAQIDISSIMRIEKQRNSVHEKVFTTFSVFEENGEKYFQIDTYGKPDRKNPEKISQSIQMNCSTAKHIAQLIMSEYKM